jgi:aldehyde:ferredoxin oxidoreductase
METMNNYNGTMLIVDLATGECETEDLPVDLVEKSLGGAALNMELYEKYKDREPLIAGTGLFTATFLPCSCLGVITGKSPLSSGIGHAPITWQTGIELKLTGFDFVVILGKSEKPVRLWLHDGLADIDDAQDIWGKDVWESTDKIREAYGDDMIQSLLIGKAGENKVPVAQISENYWGSKDKFGFGSVFGEKNVKAIAMRGLGLLEVAEDFFQKCTELKNEILEGSIKGKSGIKDFIAPLGVDTSLKGTIESLTHRVNACYNCPYPCYTFLKYREAPTAMAQDGVEEPGCLVADLSGIASFHFLGNEAAQAIEKCCRMGIEPTAAGLFIKEQGIKDLAGALDALDKLATAGQSLADAGLPNYFGLSPWPIPNEIGTNLVQSAGIFSNAVPPKALLASESDFGAGSTAEDKAMWWIQRQALAYTIGICPIFILLTPEMTTPKVAELVRLAAEWEEFDTAALEGITSELIKKSIQAEAQTGEVHASLKADGFDNQFNSFKGKLLS